MRALIILLIGSWLTVGAGLVVPAQAEEGPVYQNAEIVRVDNGARTLVYRDGSGEKTMAVDSAILPELSKLKRGDKVILTTRVVRSDAGETRFVTEIRPTSPGLGASAATAKERALSPLRVMNTDPGARMVTVIDEAGTTQVLAVRGEGVRELARLKPGDTVVLSVGPEPGAAASGDVVLRIRRVDPTVTAPPSDSPGTPPIVVAPNPPANPGGGIPVERVTESIPSIPPPAPAAVVVANPATQATAVVDAGVPLRNFETSAAAMAVKAGYLERDWSAFRETCLREPGPTASTRPEWLRLLDGSILPQGDDACRQTHQELVKRAEKFKAELSAVTQDARRDGVPPGQIREVLRRHHIDI